jgi:hypothetical protein
MRPVTGTRGNLRGSALWGKGPKSGTRSSALWGKPGRGFAVLAAVIALGVPTGASASAGNAPEGTALVPAALLQNAQAHPARLFNVIVTARAGKSTAFAAKKVQGAAARIPAERRD